MWKERNELWFSETLILTKKIFLFLYAHLIQLQTVKALCCVVFRFGFRIDAPSGGRRARRNQAPLRAATQDRPRTTKWRTRSTTNPWTRTLTTTRSDCCCENTAELSLSYVWGHIMSDTHTHTHTYTRGLLHDIMK